MDRDDGGGRSDPSEEGDERGRSSEPDRRQGNRNPPPPAAGPPTPGGSGGGTKTGAARSSLRRWYDSLSTGVQWLVKVVVGAGAVAAAIGSILALWPGPDPAPHAKLTNITRDPDVSLQEWEDRHRGENNAQASTGEPMLLAAYQLAQAETDGLTITEDTTTQEETTTDETMTEETTTEETTTDEDGGPDTGGDIVTEPLPSPEQRARLNRGLDLAVEEPSVPELDLGVCGEDLSDPSCGLRSTMTYLLRPQSEVTAVVVAERLAELFDGIRASDEDLPPEPLGVTVNFDVSLTGFQGDEAEIRWSLYSARGGGAVPRDWLRNQRVLSLEAEADEDSGSGEFWAPLPSREGPYVIRFGVYDEDGDRVTYGNTRRFP
jgi:hypothetical protein